MTETLLKRYGLPVVVLSPHLAAAVLIAYLGEGRFAVPRHVPVLSVAVPAFTEPSGGSIAPNDLGRTRNFETAFGQTSASDGPAQAAPFQTGQSTSGSAATAGLANR